MENFFEWKKEYNTGIKTIDDQHKTLLNLMCDLLQKIKEQNSDTRIGEIIKKLIDYTNLHFTTEEKYFDDFNYPDKEDHIEEHSIFINKINDLKNRHDNNELEVLFDLVDFLEDWFLSHVLNSDKKYVKCFLDNGIKQ